MKQSIERNSTRMFKTALEVLRDNVNEMLAHCKSELEPYDEARQNKFTESHDALDVALVSFDNALEITITARNEFVDAQNLELDTLLVNTSKAKGGRR